MLELAKHCKKNVCDFGRDWMNRPMELAEDRSCHPNLLHPSDHHPPDNRLVREEVEDFFPTGSATLPQAYSWDVLLHARFDFQLMRKSGFQPSAGGICDKQASSHHFHRSCRSSGATHHSNAWAESLLLGQLEIIVSRLYFSGSGGLI
ncbi:hypothetical protein PM082_011185 [Marasmius tenuissimus]|nr:hypothetical protein PM082_011185 [Marasmius tenuissimus]